VIRSVLVANRGEIAVRIIRTLRLLGLVSVAVYSDPDRDARHVIEADMAFRLGPGPAPESYLSTAALIEALAMSGADAVHPGYGFLSENAGFARAVTAAGAIWIGPPPAAIEAMGDKIRAKTTVSAAGVPVVPGRMDPGLDDDELVEAALAVGLPVLIKPSAGGGGKGMHRVTEAIGLRPAIAAARREARAGFGDDTLLVERWVTRPRHIEVQIFADSHGRVIHLGERECSLQRRHQKVVEEAPSLLLDDATRARLGASAVEAARACGYVGAGTVEFIVSADRPEEYFFLEMNTRLQVEHPVTEAVTGLDLVALQIRVADGLPLGLEQDSVSTRGHALEARIYAEDPIRDFLPATGRVLAYREPRGPGIRIDSSIVTGTVVGTDYDPMLAKIIAWGEDRDEARRRLIRALQEITLLGVTTNVGFLAALLDQADVAGGALDTELIERVLPDLGPPAEEGRRAAVAAGALWALQAEPMTEADTPVDPWDIPGSWRVGGAGITSLRLTVDGAPFDVAIRGRARRMEISAEPATSVPDDRRPGDRTPGDRTLVGAQWTGRHNSVGRLWLERDGRTETWTWAEDGLERWLSHRALSWRIRSVDQDVTAGPTSRSQGGPVTSPMPGTVLSVAVSVGDTVVAGVPLVVVEAMKMEHVIIAPSNGTVTELLVRAGQSVRLDEPLVVVSSTAVED
jgi:acetyl-CoA/propionyl-CoA carboxylase biotin carboxyl carrier protein